jgi:hypothetical protein
MLDMADKIAPLLLELNNISAEFTQQQQQTKPPRSGKGRSNTPKQGSASKQQQQQLQRELLSDLLAQKHISIEVPLFCVERTNSGQLPVELLGPGHELLPAYTGVLDEIPYDDGCSWRTASQKSELHEQRQELSLTPVNDDLRREQQRRQRLTLGHVARVRMGAGNDVSLSLHRLFMPDCSIRL